MTDHLRRLLAEHDDAIGCERPSSAAWDRTNLTASVRSIRDALRTLVELMEAFIAGADRSRTTAAKIEVAIGELFGESHPFTDLSRDPRHDPRSGPPDSPHPSRVGLRGHARTNAISRAKSRASTALNAAMYCSRA